MAFASNAAYQNARIQDSIMPTLRLRYTVTADRQINLTLPPDFPVGVVDIEVRRVDVSEAVDGTAEQLLRSDLRSLFEFLETLPPTGRTTEEIDRQIQEERDSWE